MNASFKLVLGPLMAGFSMAAPLAAQESRYTPEELHRHFQNEVEAYVMQQGDVTLKLHTQPLMHWQNPERNHELGATYIWKKAGIPQVLVSVFTFEYNNRVRCRHEMISLSDEPLECELHSENVWSPRRPGLVWQPIDDVAPADSPPRRLFQMRSIARQFSATLHPVRKRPESLTLIPQPLTRYRSPAQGVVDGAIFSLAVVTDPEILLLIEANDAGGSPKFRFAPVRANYNALELHRRGKQVWAAPLVIELQRTTAGQRPWALDPFFVFTPSQPLPPPGTIE